MRRTFCTPQVAQHRYLSVESLAKVQMAVIDTDEEVMPALAAAS